MIEAFFILTAVFAVIIAGTWVYFINRVDNLEDMCLDLAGALADIKYVGNHPSRRAPRELPDADGGFDPFSDQGVLG